MTRFYLPCCKYRDFTRKTVAMQHRALRPGGPTQTPVEGQVKKELKRCSEKLEVLLLETGSIARRSLRSDRTLTDASALNFVLCLKIFAWVMNRGRSAQ